VGHHFIRLQTTEPHLFILQRRVGELAAVLTGISGVKESHTQKFENNMFFAIQIPCFIYICLHIAVYLHHSSAALPIPSHFNLYYSIAKMRNNMVFARIKKR
jgi:hypothetical protein